MVCARHILSRGDVNEMEFKDRLKILRDSKQITQQSLADYIGVSRPTISGYETKSFQPSHEKLSRIAEYLGVSIDYLINGGPQDLELVDFNKQTDQANRTELIKLYSTLSYPNRNKVIEYTRFISQSELEANEPLTIKISNT